MQAEITGILAEAALLIILALISWLSKKAANWLNDEEFGKELGNFAYLADIAVMGVEQIAKHDETIDKFEEAKRKLIILGEKNGIKASEEMVDTFIEAAVKRMNEAGLGNPSKEEKLLQESPEFTSVEIQPMETKLSEEDLDVLAEKVAQALADTGKRDLA